MNEQAVRRLITAARCALGDLTDIMPEHDPHGDREHSGWKTMKDLRDALRDMGEDVSDYDSIVETTGD